MHGLLWDKEPGVEEHGPITCQIFFISMFPHKAAKLETVSFGHHVFHKSSRKRKGAQQHIVQLIQDAELNAEVGLLTKPSLLASRLRGDLSLLPTRCALQCIERNKVAWLAEGNGRGRLKGLILTSRTQRAFYDR